jgi:hypothetical protein
MGTYEKLHLANNLDALDLLAKQDFNVINVNNYKFKQICNALSKLYKKTQLNILNQEKTYILLARYLTFYNHLLNTQTDKNFVKIRFGSEYEKVLIQYEETKRSLQERYALKFRTVPDKPVQEEKDNVVEVSPRVFQDEFITCQQLFSALERKCNILLVDARPDYDFKESRIDHINCINVPDQSITSGLSAHALGKKLATSTQKIWETRDTFDVIVLYDWNTSSDNFALTKLNKLRSALVDWDLNRNYSEPPVILNGGYLEMLQTYPTKCINPRVYLYQKNTELDELLELDNIKYPTESDNKTHVMGIPEEKKVDELGVNDENEVTKTKESLIKENKEITINRQGIISQLLQEEKEWKKINELCNQENNITNLANLKTKESEISVEINRLRDILDDLNKKKDDVKKKLELDFQCDPQDDLKSEDLKEITKIEEDDSEKLRILDIIDEERSKELKKARALKPKKEERESKGNNNEVRDSERPVINRATKPAVIPFAQRFRIEPLEYMTSGLVGLRNIRNTCYISTVMQCIRNIPALKRLFCKGTYSRYNIRNPAAIIHETAGLIRQLWSKSVKSIDPQEFYNKVGQLEATYKLGNHEDCMEFFLFLLNHLCEDCCYDINLPPIMTPKQKAWYNQFEGKNSVFIDWFYHQIRIKQNCNQCDQKTFKFEIESTFMLSVPEHDFSLDDLMDEYMADYIIPEYCCSKCKRPVNNQKEICYEPKIMVIVLKRYRQAVVNGVLTLKKVESRAHFQVKKFRLGNCLYQLNAIAVHSGDMNYGHYTAVALTSKG